MSDPDDTAAEVEQIRQDWNRRCDPDPREMYERDAEFRALVDRAAAQGGDSAFEVLIGLDRLRHMSSGPYRVSNSGGALPAGLEPDRDYWFWPPGSPGMLYSVRAELRAESVKCEDDPATPAHHPGARRPGHKEAPPVPRWARKRR